MTRAYWVNQIAHTLADHLTELPPATAAGIHPDAAAQLSTREADQITWAVAEVQRRLRTFGAPRRTTEPDHHPRRDDDYTPAALDRDQDQTDPEP